MNHTTFQLSVRNHAITVHQWLPETAPTRILQLSHGMMEHALRYTALAQALTRQNIAVFCQDHLGHGQTTKTISTLGHLQAGGWQIMTQTQSTLTAYIQSRYPKVPITLMGHSMGSFLVQTLLYTHPQSADNYHGIILSGTSCEPPLSLLTGRYLSQLLLTLAGSDVSGKWLHFLVFSPLNWAIKGPHQTKNDWLSQDYELNKTYEDDPYCGFPCSTRFYNELFSGLSALFKKENLQKINKTIPFLFLTGQDDPLSKKAKKVTRLIQAYEKVGKQNISSIVYPSTRHVVLSQPKFDTVVQDIVKFIH